VLCQVMVCISMKPAITGFIGGPSAKAGDATASPSATAMQTATLEPGVFTNGMPASGKPQRLLSKRNDASYDQIDRNN
jgi:hypothetical protein